MERVNKILKNKKHIEYMEKIFEFEKNRIFCKHGYNHIFDVARIAYILNLENDYNLDKELIYITSLLHDIGRWKEYEDGSDHAEVSAILSKNILTDVNFSSEEIDLIQVAIREHRKKGNASNELSKILYSADKLSRECYRCKSIDKCKKFPNRKSKEKINICY